MASGWRCPEPGRSRSPSRGSASSLKVVAGSTGRWAAWRARYLGAWAPRGCCWWRSGAEGRPGLGPGADHDQVLLLEAGVVLAAEVPLVGEIVQRLVHLRLAAVLARVLAGGDRRSVAVLEVLAVFVRVL